MHYLIIKHGALGDVVRTSYFATALRRKYGDSLRLSWITNTAAIPLLRYNPDIDDLWTEFRDGQPFQFDCIYSLDDEEIAIDGVMKLNTFRIIGIYRAGDGGIGYSVDSAEWFDMGLRSLLGKVEADAKKKKNQRGHSEIFSDIFDVNEVKPVFWGVDRLQRQAKIVIKSEGLTIGINPWAGGRWPSKELKEDQLRILCQRLLIESRIAETGGKLVLLGAGDDRILNERLAAELNSDRICVANTDNSLLQFAAIVKALDYIITSDSLALHLAVSQNIKFLAFFSPTSAAEIDGFGIGEKLLSTSTDYCSYKSDAKNDTITAERLIGAMKKHQPEFFKANA